MTSKFGCLDPRRKAAFPCAVGCWCPTGRGRIRSDNGAPLRRLDHPRVDPFAASFADSFDRVEVQNSHVP